MSTEDERFDAVRRLVSLAEMAQVEIDEIAPRPNKKGLTDDDKELIRDLLMESFGSRTEQDGSMARALRSALAAQISDIDRKYSPEMSEIMLDVLKAL